MWRVPGHEDAVTLATIISLKLYLVLRIPAMAAVFEDIGRSSRLLHREPSHPFRINYLYRACFVSAVF